MKAIENFKSQSLKQSEMTCIRGGETRRHYQEYRPGDGYTYVTVIYYTDVDGDGTLSSGDKITTTMQFRRQIQISNEAV
ncbi:hypothetical protein ACFO7M_11715 [Flavobacterium sp. GCM10023249]